MKSINEKAIEYNKKINFVCKGDVPNEDFKAGGNYVLEEIEKLVKFNRWAAQDLYELIEQLKK